MPFATRPDLPPNPSVKIFFIGLNILQPTANHTCETFVHKLNAQHKLLIETRRKRPNKPDVTMMRLPGPLVPTATDPFGHHGLRIRTAGITPRVEAYTGPPTSDGSSSLFDGFVMSRILDVSPGQPSSSGGRPSIFIDNGVFYTAATVPVVAPATVQLVKKTVPPTPPKVINLTQVPTIIGANIYLNPNDTNQKVTLQWKQNGQEVFLDLRPTDSSTTYEIYVINEPLFEPDTPGPTHDEFDEYFKILPAVTRHEQFNLVITGTLPDRGSTRAPCMSILLTD